MHWVNVDSESRKHDLPQLMEHVRLPLLSQDYLVQNVEENVLMRSNALCKYFHFTLGLYIYCAYFNLKISYLIQVKIC